MSRLTEIPYRADSTRLYGALRAMPGAVFLDSGHPSVCGGRFDILAADPGITVTTRGRRSVIDRRGETATSADDPLALVRRELGPCAVDSGAGLPFAGGAIGFFGYDLGRRYERIGGAARDDVGLPDMALGIYDWAIVVDHEERRSWLAAQCRDPATVARWDALVALARGDDVPSGRTEFEVLSPVRATMSRPAYAAAFRRIMNHIRRGDCYQVNLTQRFEATVGGDAWPAYLALRDANPAPFSAFIDLPSGQILSSSPERFLRVTGDRIETKPIKGTRRRSVDPAEDRRLAEELRASAKDRAENVMIVDLLRNDLGRCCEPGSVRVEQLFAIESFASVHHMVSTVVGTLRAEHHPLDLLRACFPGGSITGAPKVAAMQIIDEVEPIRRGVYCGSIGYVGFDGQMDTNIAIRTLVRRGDSIYAWAGGGIVADSELDAEYQESLDKAAALLSILTPRTEPRELTA